MAHRDALRTVTDARHLDYDNGPGQRPPARLRGQRFRAAAVRRPARRRLDAALVASVQRAGRHRPEPIDGQNNDYVLGTTRNQGGNRTLDTGLINALARHQQLAPISAGQIDSDRVIAWTRLSKSVGVGGGRRVDFIAQVFNLLGTDNLGGIGSGWVTSALSDSFGPGADGTAAGSRPELAVRITF